MSDVSGFMIPPGAILNRDLSTIHDLDMNAADQIQEYVSHSWYKYGDANKDKGLHPWDGETAPQFELGPNAKGTKTNIEALDEGGNFVQRLTLVGGQAAAVTTTWSRPRSRARRCRRAAKRTSGWKA